MNDEEPSAIMGTSCGVKTMADNTLRVSFDIEPRFAQIAFAMFGTRGTPVALARLLPQAALEQSRQETIAQNNPKGGVLTKLAGMFCNDPKFREWLRIQYDPLPQTAEDAAEIIRRTCRIESRSMLDHEPAAANLFHHHFRLPYSAWQDGRNQ